MKNKLLYIFLSLLIALFKSNVKAQDSSLDVNVRLQIRNTTTLENIPENRMELRRARITLEGHLLNDNNKFKLQLGFSPKDLKFIDDTSSQIPLLDGYVDFTHIENMNILIGQHKIPFSRERITSSGDLQMVDRSIASAEFDPGRDIGIMFHSNNFLNLNFLRYYLGIYSGTGQNHPSSIAIKNNIFLYLARLELVSSKDFSDHSQGDLNRSKELEFSIGSSYAFVDTENLFASDLVLNWNGLSLLESFTVRHSSENKDGFGTFTQLGYLLPTIDLEFAGRYSNVIKNNNSSLENLNEIGGGTSYYFNNHKLKLQLDAIHYWNNESFSAGDEEIRLQIQIVS